MRELNISEVNLVSGGTDAGTMDVGCFAATVYFGISPFFGPVAMFGAAFSLVSACHEYIFDN